MVISGAGNASVAVSSTCTGDTATASITSGTGPFTYAWSNGASTQAITGVAAGNYTVTVSSGGGCSTTASATIASVTGLTLAAPAITDATCGNNNGGASISVTGGAGPYTYAWSNSANTQAISNVAAVLIQLRLPVMQVAAQLLRPLLRRAALLPFRPPLLPTQVAVIITAALP